MSIPCLCIPLFIVPFTMFYFACTLHLPKYLSRTSRDHTMTGIRSILLEQQFVIQITAFEYWNAIPCPWSCYTMDNTNCNICNRKFHNHAKIVECVSCYIRYHLKCITLECEHQAYILFHLLEWICETCNSLIFPFNQLESDNDFLHALNFIDNTAMLSPLSSTHLNLMKLMTFHRWMKLTQTQIFIIVSIINSSPDVLTLTNYRSTWRWRRNGRLNPGWHFRYFMWISGVYLKISIILRII